MDENRKTGKPGIAYKGKKWEEFREEFNKRADKSYTQKQLKNKMDNLRTDRTIWKQLLGKETGLGFNHATGCIRADNAWWDAKIRENAKYGKFRYQGLEFRDESEIIFGDVVVTSENAWTPSMGVPIDSNGGNNASEVPQEIIQSDDEDIYVEEDCILVQNSQLRGKRKVTQDTGDKVAKHKSKVSNATTMRKSLQRLVQAAENHNETEKEEMEITCHVRGQYSIPECMKVLDDLLEEGRLDDDQFT